MEKPEGIRRFDVQSPATAARAGRLWIYAVIAVVVLAIAALAGLLPRWHQRAALRAETHELSIPTVTVIHASPGKNVSGVPLPAEVKPLVEAPIYARANGYVKRWMVDLGAQVTNGQILAEIDTPELTQELARSKAELAQAEAALSLARTTGKRWAELLKTASVSEQEAAEKQADEALKAATVEASRANVRRLEESVSFSRVSAPFAGTITARTTDVGQLVSATSGKELFRLAQIQTLRVYVHVPQTLARSIQPGQTAEVLVPDLPGTTIPAKVVRTAGAIEPETRTLLVELELDNKDNKVLAGNFAQVRFKDLKVEAPLTVPSNALLFRAEGSEVGVVDAEGKVELRHVELGRDYGSSSEILSGITASDRIIFNPSDSLVDGATVRVVEASKIK
jgi:membrane fusion protein (multidrug efflux system)